MFFGGFKTMENKIDEEIKDFAKTMETLKNVLSFLKDQPHITDIKSEKEVIDFKQKKKCVNLVKYTKTITDLDWPFSTRHQKTFFFCLKTENDVNKLNSLGLQGRSYGSASINIAHWEYSTPTDANYGFHPTLQITEQVQLH